MYPEPVKVVIVIARNTDRYALVYVFADGSQSTPTGSYESFAAAYQVARKTVEPFDIEDGTLTDD